MTKQEIRDRMCPIFMEAIGSQKSDSEKIADLMYHVGNLIDRLEPSPPASPLFGPSIVILEPDTEITHIVARRKEGG